MCIRLDSSWLVVKLEVWPTMSHRIIVFSLFCRFCVTISHVEESSLSRLYLLFFLYNIRNVAFKLFMVVFIVMLSFYHLWINLSVFIFSLILWCVSCLYLDVAWVGPGITSPTVRLKISTNRTTFILLAPVLSTPVWDLLLK